MKLASEIADAFSGEIKSILPNRKPLTKAQIAEELRLRELQDQREREERAVLLAELFPGKFEAPDLFKDQEIPDIFK